LYNLLMPRVARIVATGYPHHITQRGNYRQKVFKERKDYLKYLSLLQEYSAKYNVSILAYCLMPNHVHLIIVPREQDAMANVLKIVHMRYAQYMNEKEKQRGHLWQDRYYSCILDDIHLLTAASYIERNPVRAGLSENPWGWEWSSARAHISDAAYLFTGESLFDFIEANEGTWKDYLVDSGDTNMLDELRKHTRSGRPLVGKKTLKELETQLKRKLTILPRGRPW